jgi:hypothetical protein
LVEEVLVPQVQILLVERLLLAAGCIEGTCTLQSELLPCGR